MSETPAPYGTGETRMPSFEDFKERVEDHLGTSLYPMALKCAIDFYDNWQGFRILGDGLLLLDLVKGIEGVEFVPRGANLTIK